MRVSDWLDDTRTSYDTVAVSYADLLRDALAREPFQRGILALFAELIHAKEAGPVADVGCSPAGSPPTCTASAWTRSASTCHPP